MKCCLHTALTILLVVCFVACGKDDDKERVNYWPSNPNMGGGSDSGEDPVDNPVDTAQSAQAFDSVGASTATFTVDKGIAVRFSRGNLQYQASTGAWRFAEHQYDYIGSGNSSASSSYSGWIDLFGWGTWQPDKTPWQTSTASADYSWSASETDAAAIGDGWHTLSIADWLYLVNTRDNASEKYGEATVCGVRGIVILPDNWTLPENLTFSPGFSGGVFNDYSLNVYSVDQWEQMELAGAVFLPAAGDRMGTFVDGVGAGGFYWSSTVYSEGSSWYLFFNGMTKDVNVVTDYCRGLSVRLVRK